MFSNWRDNPYKCKEHTVKENNPVLEKHEDTFQALTELKSQFWPPLKWIIQLILPEQLN